MNRNNSYASGYRNPNDSNSGSRFGRGDSRFNGGGSKPAYNGGGYSRNSQPRNGNGNNHDYTVVPNLVYVTKTLRVNVGKITKAVYDRTHEVWHFHFSNKAIKSVQASALNEGTKVILSRYHYLLKISDTQNEIVKINVNSIIKAKLDTVSNLWYLELVGGEKLEVNDNVINDGGMGNQFGCTSMVTVVDNDSEVYKINRYFISMVDRTTESDTEAVSFTVSYNDQSMVDDMFLHSELTEQGLAVIAKYRSAVSHSDIEE